MVIMIKKATYTSRLPIYCRLNNIKGDIVLLYFQYNLLVRLTNSREYYSL